MPNEICNSTSKFKIQIQILNSKSQVLSANGPNHRKRRLKISGNDMPAAAPPRQETWIFTLLKNEGSGLRIGYLVFRHSDIHSAMQSAIQLAIPPFTQPVIQPVFQSVFQQVIQSVVHLFSQPLSHSFIHSVCRPVSHSVGRSVSLSACLSVSHSAS